MPTEAPPAPPPTPAKPASQPAAPAAKSPPPPLNSLSMYDEIDKIVTDNAEAEQEKAKPSEKKSSKNENADPKPAVGTREDNVRDVDVQDGKDKPTEPGEQPPTKGKITPEFRQIYEDTRKERDSLRSELESLKKSTPKDDPERAAITERLTKEEKRRSELEEEIKHLNYERSSEYKEKFQEPINRAYTKALKEMKEYVVTEADGNERSATAEDFAAVMRLGPGEVVKQTQAWFGEAAPEVRALRRQILELDERASEAVKNYKEKGAEIETSRTAEQAKNRQRAEELWEKHNKEAVEKYPQFFAPKEGDDEGNKLLESGYALADMHFNPPKDLPMEKRVGLAAQVRHRVAGFARVVRENKRLQEKLTAAEAELEEFRDSEPGKGDGERVATKGPKTWEQEIDDLAGKNR